MRRLPADQSSGGHIYPTGSLWRPLCPAGLWSVHLCCYLCAQGRPAGLPALVSLLRLLQSCSWLLIIPPFFRSCCTYLYYGYCHLSYLGHIFCGIYPGSSLAVFRCPCTRQHTDRTHRGLDFPLIATFRSRCRPLCSDPLC